MLILVGASATGKTEIVKELVKSFNMKKLVTYTTRPIRINEIDGIDYNFVSKEEFLKLKKTDSFVETVEYNGNYYGTLKKDISKDKVVILEPQGVCNFFKKIKKDLYSVYIKTSKDICEERMIKRGDKMEDIVKRLVHDEKIFDIANISHIDAIIQNDDNDIYKVTEQIYNMYINKD